MKESHLRPNRPPTPLRLLSWPVSPSPTVVSECTSLLLSSIFVHPAYLFYLTHTSLLFSSSHLPSSTFSHSPLVFTSLTAFSILYLLFSSLFLINFPSAFFSSSVHPAILSPSPSLFRTLCLWYCPPVRPSSSVQPLLLQLSLRLFWTSRHSFPLFPAV